MGKVYQEQWITELKENEVFVFGSNLQGIHGAGAAKIAFDKFGAIWGKSFGPQGQSYAVPTKDLRANKPLTLSTIRKYLEVFKEYAKINEDQIFYLTPVGTGFSKYSVLEIEAIMPIMPENVIKTWEWV